MLSVSPTTKQRLSTPQLLKIGLFATWGTSVLLLIVTIAAVQGQRQAIKTVGKDAAPSIIAAQHIRAGLADMDANAANELLVRSGQNPEAVKAYEARRQEVTNALVTAAENITYGDLERRPIQTLELAFGEYQAKIQQARVLHQQGNTAGMILAYRAATEVMDNTLLPAASDLDNANLKALDRTYTEQQFATTGSLLLVTASGVLLLGTVIGMQVFLYRRTNRILNPLLLGASVVAFLFLNQSTGALIAAAQHLKVAKQDAFTSLHALWQTRALAYSANGDESRYLLDAAQAPTHEQAFRSKTAKLANPPQGQSLDTMVMLANRGQRVAGFTGYLAEELSNVTFKGEQDAAVKTLATFSSYLQIDQQIRQFQENNQHREALILCTGNQPGQSNWAFDQFDHALDETLGINQQAFNQAVEQGFQELNGFEVITPAAMGAIALLTLLGLRPRLQEYSA